MKQTGNVNTFLPIISLYVFAGYRLMPAIQAIYGCFIKVAFVRPSLNNLAEDIKNLKKFEPDNLQNPLVLNKTIALKNIHYNYPNSSRSALKDINIRINAKTTVIS